MIVWSIAYIFYLLCNVAILFFDFPGDVFSAIIFLPLLVILWLVGAVGAIILLVKSFRKKERKQYLAFMPLFCISLVVILQLLPLPWHIWNAQLTYLGNRAHYREVIKNPPKENLISQTRERTVIGFQYKIYRRSCDCHPGKHRFDPHGGFSVDLAAMCLRRLYFSQQLRQHKKMKFSRSCKIASLFSKRC